MTNSLSKSEDSMERRGSRRVKRGERGNAMLEFGIAVPFILLTLFGSVSLGVMLGRSVLVNQVCRDLAHMYVDGVDFTQAPNQNIAVQLASGIGMTAAGGNGVVILSRIMTVYQTDCDAAGYTATCGSLGQCVITQRVYVGNQALRASNFGTPNAALMNASGNISSAVYLQNTDSSVQTSGFAPLLIAAGEAGLIPQGNFVWVAETFYQAPDLAFLGNTFFNTSASGGSYARFIF
jgi:Flp pilus assembly protein TadG